MIWMDGTASAERACRAAIEIARAARAALTAVAVIDTGTLASLFKQRLLVIEEMQEFEAELAALGRAYLDAVREAASKAGVRIDTVLLKGVSHEAVLSEQSARSADLLVIGAFKSADAHRDLIARARQLILDRAPCAVLLVP